MATGSSPEPQPGPSGNCEAEKVDFPEICQFVARVIGKDWIQLGRKMKFMEPELEYLVLDHQIKGTEEIAYQLLVKWQKKLGKAATVNLLAQHLQAIGHATLPFEILKMAKESTEPAHISPMPIIRSTRMHASFETGAWESILTTLQIEHSRLEIPKMPWLEKWETDFEDYYVDLTITDKSEERSLHLHEIFIPKKENIFTRIFDKMRHSPGQHELPTRILIEGPAGYGKSTLARKLCFDHAKKKSYIRHFDAVILLRLREFSRTLEEMIIDTYELENCSAKLVSEILMQNQRKILFVLDGLDELNQDNHPHVTPLLKGKRYPQSTVIVTSRTGCMKLEGQKPDSSATNLLHCMTSRISIVGITGDNRVKFLQLYLKGYSSEKCASFIKSTDTKFGLSEMMEDNLFVCPLYLLLLVVVAEETDLASLRSKTQLYKQLFNFILRRMLAKEGQVDRTCDFFEFVHENPPAYVKMLYRFGSFAGDALQKGQYTFSEEELLRSCGNDGTILKMGILTRNDSKRGLTRESWFEPIHLSFLEFAYAYSVWVSCVSTHPVLRSLPSIYLWRLLWRKPAASFLCGLCWKQFPTLLSAFTHSYRDLLKVMKLLDPEEMMTESQLEPSELGKSLLSVVPVEFTVDDDDSEEEIPILLKEALMHALQTRRDQRIILKKSCFATTKQQGRLKVTTRSNASGISEDWCELATSQNITIREFHFPEISFTLCEAPLQEQLGWLSHFMTIQVVLQNKPIRTIYYECPSEEVSKLIDLMTELIRQERLVALRLEMWEECAESWKEFIRCANESKELLDLSLQNWADSPLVVDLTLAKGKRWRKVELIGNVVVSVGSQLVDVSDLDSFVRGMPSNIQTLEIRHNTFGSISVFRNDSLPTVHNVDEVFISFHHNSNMSLVQSSVSESLKNLKVLTIDMDSREVHDLTTFLLSMIYHCHSLERVQLGWNCTEQLIATFLDRLSKEKWPAFSDRGESIPTNLHLNTLMIPAYVSVLTSATAALVKEALQTGCIKYLWVRCDYYLDDRCTIIRNVVELFSPTEFNLKAEDEQSWPKYIRRMTRCILEVSVDCIEF